MLTNKPRITGAMLLKAIRETKRDQSSLQGCRRSTSDGDQEFYIRDCAWSSRGTVVWSQIVSRDHLIDGRKAMLERLDELRADLIAKRVGTLLIVEMAKKDARL